MDTRKVIETMSKLVREKRFEEAKQVLLEALAGASAQGDIQAEDLVLSELVELNCLMEPPNPDEAEEFSLRREGLRRDAYAKLQSARLLYQNQNAGNHARAVAKLREAIDLGRIQKDPRTVYTSLGLLGRIHLELGNGSEAVVVLGELEEMVSAKEPFVVGDETWFLENLRALGLEDERVARIASTLAPICHDPAFKKRLEALTMRA